MILVDRLRRYPSGYWCHMVTDSSPEELHDFAHRLGLHRDRFQQHERLPHYDLRPHMREKALELGAEAVSSKELFRRGREAFLKKHSLRR
jgi:hypothetical protein